MKKPLYGPQTEAALSNFPFDYHLTQRDFIYAIVMIKKAAAIANKKVGKVSDIDSQNIQNACDTILSKKYDDQFVVKAHHGGAGTSINMNVNEVLAHLSGTHANDHVNASQSTNDVNPSALKIATLFLTRDLLENIEHLISILNEKAQDFVAVHKLARTHMQDAIPTTLGEEFTSYCAILKRDKKRIEDAMVYLNDLNIGGTAIGNSVNAPKEYISQFYREIVKITGIKQLKPADNFMSQTSSDTDFCFLSSAITILCLDMSKIATDLRFMASGPQGGIGEISFKELQPGSSIMPGKVNPVIAETINQTYYLVNGKNTSIHQAAEAAHLELGVMLPIIADSLITILKTVSTAVKIFADKGIKNIVVNKERCREHLEKSTAYATKLTSVFGYDRTSVLVKESLKAHMTIREVVVGKKLLSEKEFDRIINN